MSRFINKSLNEYDVNELPLRLSSRIAFPLYGIAQLLGCWIWVGTLTQGFNGGYGRIYSDIHKRPLASHRVVYEQLVGPIPPKYQIDHLCRIRPCCNPAHLEPITAKENSRRRVLSTRCAQPGDNIGDFLLVDIPILDGTEPRV